MIRTSSTTVKGMVWPYNWCIHFPASDPGGWSYLACSTVYIRKRHSMNRSDIPFHTWLQCTPHSRCNTAMVERHKFHTEAPDSPSANVRENVCSGSKKLLFLNFEETTEASCHWGTWGTCPPDSVATLVNSLQNRVKSITLCVNFNANTGALFLWRSAFRYIIMAVSLCFLVWNCNTKVTLTPSRARGHRV